MIVVVPFAAVPADRHLGGTLAVVVEGFALLLAVAFLWQTRWNLKREHITQFLRTGPNTAVLLLVGVIAISCVFAPNKFFGIQETLRWGAGVLLFFVVAYHFRRSSHLYLLIDTLMFLGIVTALLSLGQYAIDPDMRGATLFGNQQLLGSFLMLLLPVAVVVALDGNTSVEKTTFRQLAAQLATVLMAGCLLLAQTRSAWLGSLASLLVLGFLMAVTSKFSADWRAQKHKLVLPGVLVVVALGFVILMSGQNNAIVSRVSTLATVSGQGSWQSRLQQWQGTLEMIKERPLTGWGIGQYALAQHQFTDAGVKLSSNGLGVRASLAEQAHDFYLQTTAELGIVGLLLMLSVLVTFVVAGVKRVRQMDPGIQRSLLMASLASIAAFSVDALGSPSWQTVQISLFFWLMLGVGVACLRPRSHSRRDQQESLTVVPRMVRPIAITVACLILVLLVAPTASVSAASVYNTNDNEHDAAFTIAQITLGISALALLFGQTSNPTGQSSIDQSTTGQ
jgi:O-antigen ligase